jgi:FlaA1/EpsC-like NDP-sugar epimerase
MIRLAGYTEQQIEIRFTGLRPGEKLFEELLADDETTIPTPHPKVRVARTTAHIRLSVSDLVDWLIDVPDGRPESVRSALRRFVPEYRPVVRDTQEIRLTTTDIGGR